MKYSGSPCATPNSLDLWTMATVQVCFDSDVRIVLTVEDKSCDDYCNGVFYEMVVLTIEKSKVVVLVVEMFSLNFPGSFNQISGQLSMIVDLIRSSTSA